MEIKKCIHFFWITKSPFCIILRIADTRLEWKKYHLFNLKALQSTQHSFSMYTAVSRFRDWVHKTYIITTNKTATKIFALHIALFSPLFFFLLLSTHRKNITGKERKENLMHFMYVRKKKHRKSLSISHSLKRMHSIKRELFKLIFCFAVRLFLAFPCRKKLFFFFGVIIKTIFSAPPLPDNFFFSLALLCLIIIIFIPFSLRRWKFQICILSFPLPLPPAIFQTQANDLALTHFRFRRD
jgi:hypothetical protein